MDGRPYLVQLEIREAKLGLISNYSRNWRIKLIELILRKLAKEQWVAILLSKQVDALSPTWLKIDTGPLIGKTKMVWYVCVTQGV